MIKDEKSLVSGVTLWDGDESSVLARIDHYELIRELGGGGFGTVYLARDTVSDTLYAVKGLPPFVKNNREELENIKENFALVARLGHTNIARAHVLHLAKEVTYNSPDVRQKLRVEPNDLLMVMEFAPGVTLTQWRKQFSGGKVPIGQAMEIVRQIASALDSAHEQKVLHRDVKPANVMVETKLDGKLVVRVVDFGLAAEIRTSMGRVSREIHDTSGTRPYMAPEQWLGGRQGPATDQYALAVLFHELVTGDVPFASVFGTGDPVVMMNVVGREPFASSTDLPGSVRQALDKALSKKPEDRFGSCAEFVDALEEGGAPSAFRWKWSALCGMCAVALIGLGAWLLFSRNSGPRDDPPAADAQQHDPPAADMRQRVPSIVVVQPVTNMNLVVSVSNHVEKPGEAVSIPDMNERSRGIIRDAMRDGDDLCGQIKQLGGEHWKELQDYVEGTNLLARGLLQFDKGDLTASLGSISSATNHLIQAYHQEETFVENEKVRLAAIERKEQEAREAAAKRAEDEKRRRDSLSKAAADQALKEAKKAKKEAEENNATQVAQVGKLKELEAKTEEFLAACKAERYNDAAKLRHVVDQKNSSVQYELAYMYAFGKGVEKDYEEAVKWLRANQESAAAQALLGLMYEEGHGVAKDYEEALKLYSKAAEGGYGIAQFKLGRAYETGHGKAKDEEEALRWYDKAGENGEVAAKKCAESLRQKRQMAESTRLAIKAFKDKNWYDGFRYSQMADRENNSTIQFYIGVCYDSGYGGASKDKSQALSWFRKAAENGDHAAQFNLGVMYANGDGVEKNEAESKRWYQKAAAGGDEKAKKMLELIEERDALIRKRDEVQHNTTSALLAFKNAQWFDGFRLAQNADKNNADIQYFIGFCHLYGYGGAAHNEFEAAKWIGRSAKQNHLAAQASLGGMYLEGKGVGVNVNEGIRLIRNAADGGNALGMRLLGLAYDNGIGVPKDDAQAVRYMIKAEEAGDPEAAQHMQNFRDRFTELAVQLQSECTALMAMRQQYNPNWTGIQRLSADLIVKFTALQAFGNSLLQYAKNPQQAQQGLQQLQQMLNELHQLNQEAGRMLQIQQGLRW